MRISGGSSGFRRVYEALGPEYAHSVLLDSCDGRGKTGGFSLMAFEADQVVQLIDRTLWVNGTAQGPVSTKKALWSALEAIFPQEAPPEKMAFPFYDGWIGLVGYELNHLLEPSVPFRTAENPIGTLYFVRFRHRVVWHSETGEVAVFSPDAAWKTHVTRLLSEPPGALQPFSGLKQAAPLTASMSEADYEAQVRAIQEHIAAGDIYQANLSLRFTVSDVSEDALMPLYAALIQRNPSPFSGVFRVPEGVVLSNSPERLVKYDAATNLLETRPIAGTRGRGQSAEEEARIAETLQTDVKEQAEHLMLVDLERNDLGRVALPASVTVPEQAVLERYSHVTHLVSQVEALKSPEKSRWDVLDALFPGGTITGCPKVRCMEILREAEPVPRGLYTGSLGYLDTRGNLDFNILIRSLFYWPHQRSLSFHAGAGIVADSVPPWEYRECLRKAEVIKGVLFDDHPIHSTP